MIVIGKRDVKKDPENEQIDLSYIDLGLTQDITETLIIW
jgi:hypothetical protein